MYAATFSTSSYFVERYGLVPRHSGLLRRTAQYDGRYHVSANVAATVRNRGRRQTPGQVTLRTVVAGLSRLTQLPCRPGPLVDSSALELR